MSLTCVDLVIRSGKLKVPEWVDIVKTGKHKELPPVDPDWYYIRCAAVARHIYVRSPAGVGGMTRAFGGPYRRGVRGRKHSNGSPAIARKALQALEAIKWVEKHPSGGRRLTAQGRQDLDAIATKVKKRSKRQANLEAFQLTQV
jgi:small subunit ribosomal protein S19e